MDERLLNRLWNAVDTFFLSKVRSCYRFDRMSSMAISAGEPGLQIVRYLWCDYLGLRWDEVGRTPGPNVLSLVRTRFFSWPWYEVYDFLELVLRVLRAYYSDSADGFAGRCNQVLEDECAAWRFVGMQIAEITSEKEIVAVEQGMQDAAPLAGVQAHLRRALELYAGKESPDYRNSIKESICAVESLACIIAGEPKADLAKALRIIEERSHVEMHGALKAAFDRLYGYTSDEGGVRHKMLEEDKVGRAEAQYMLVACSAFVSYLIAKSTEAGIDLTAK